MADDGFTGWQRRSDVLAAVFVLVVILMMLIPLPAVLLDLFMALNLCLSLLVILIVLYTRNALEFTIFPTLLLLATVFGLALNVSSTRLILSQGAEFEGRIVRAFGSFVVGAPGAAGYVIGSIIFTIIMAAQFVVITKGSTRVAEVAARFTLDALPGKQMAIEAEYNSGLLSEAEATRCKNELRRETDFYGAMDGASKFVSGNVRVGILITLINLMGGLIVGVSIRGESLAAAAGTYISLTIGDGLVTQLPALLISTATGIIVTRAISDASFGRDVARQFSLHDRPFFIAAGFLAVLALLPGFPPYVLLPLAAVLGWCGYAVGRGRAGGAGDQADGSADQVGGPSDQVGRPGDKAGGFAGRLRSTRSAGQGTASAGGAPAVPAGAATRRASATAGAAIAPPDPLAVELGYALVPQVEADAGTELLNRIAELRLAAARERGVAVPHVRITDNLRLRPTEYAVKIRGVDVERGRLRGGAEELAARLERIIEQRAAELLGREEVKAMLEALKQDYPTVVEEAMATLSVGEIQRVLRALLAEGVSVRDLVAILETLGDYAPHRRDTQFLVARVRQALARQISFQHADADGVLHVLTVVPDLERRLIAAGEDGEPDLGGASAIGGGGRAGTSFATAMHVATGSAADTANAAGAATGAATANAAGAATGAATGTAAGAAAGSGDGNGANGRTVLAVPGAATGVATGAATANAAGTATGAAAGTAAGWSPELQHRWIGALTAAVRRVERQGYAPVVLSSARARPWVRSTTVREMPQLVCLADTELAEITVTPLAEVRLEERA